MTLLFTGSCYVGDNAEDLTEFLQQWNADGYPVHEVRHSVCERCSGTTFGIEGSSEGPTVVRRICRGCGHQQYIADSEEYWEEEHCYISVCVCEHEDFNVAVGFSLYTGADPGIRSLATAERCTACGTIASLAEWRVRTGDMTLLNRA